HRRFHGLPVASPTEFLGRRSRDCRKNSPHGRSDFERTLIQKRPAGNFFAWVVLEMSFEENDLMNVIRGSTRTF
ncbi:MAG: hypothetical protein ACKOA6_12640, partial [Actinomycetota bacterium]